MYSQSPLRRLLVLLALAALYFPLTAQKAEPNRITFLKGATSATVKGQLQGSEQMEYSIVARKQQAITLQLKTTPSRAAAVKLRDPDYHDLPLTSLGKGRFTALLPKDGEYQIWVLHSKESPSSATYELKVTIRSKAR